MATAPHSASGKANRAPSFGKRLAFAIFFGVIATGVSFYLMTFAALFSGADGASPSAIAGTPILRTVGVPVSLVAGAVVFAITVRRR